MGRLLLSLLQTSANQVDFVVQSRAWELLEAMAESYD
jgi:hypothetical protein